jgi:hypothetical protein
LHEEAQQTPSTQKPEAHSALPAHVTPFVFSQCPEVLTEALHDAPGPQLPLAQQTPSTQ